MIFSITSEMQSIVLAAVLGFLSASLIVSTVIGMKYYNWFTRLYSLVSSVWIGFFVYFFLGSVVYAVVEAFFGAAHMLGYAIVATGACAGTYGLVHSTDIDIKETEVHMKNLSTDWSGKKALWVSDLHLGQIHGLSFANKVVDRIMTVPHDIIFIGGDLFDGTSAPDLAELVSPFKKLKPPRGIYFVTGNHEEFGNNAKFASAIRSVGITVLEDQMMEIDGLQVIGVDYQNSSRKDDFQKIMSGFKIDKDKPSILLKHEPKHLDVASAAGVSLCISGHTHKAQLWPLGYVAKAVYKGYSYGLKDYGDMHVLVSSGVGTWGPPMRVGTDSEIAVITFS